VAGVTVPDWLKPGAKVVTWSDGRGKSGPQHVRTSQVLKVATKTFTVDGEDTRYDIRTLSAVSSDAWTPGRWCRPLDADEARAVLDTARRKATVRRAVAAVDRWQETRTRKDRLAAIAALRAVEVDEEP
jgi:hypothetical protein